MRFLLSAVIMAIALGASCTKKELLDDYAIQRAAEHNDDDPGDPAP